MILADADGHMVSPECLCTRTLMDPGKSCEHFYSAGSDSFVSPTLHPTVLIAGRQWLRGVDPCDGEVAGTVGGINHIGIRDELSDTVVQIGLVRDGRQERLAINRPLHLG